MSAKFPAHVETIHGLLRKVSPALAKRYLWWEVSRWSYWHHGRGVYVLAARKRWWAAPLWQKVWLSIEDLFARYGNLTDHGDDGIVEAVGKIGKLHLLVYRGHYDGHDALFWGRRILRSRAFYQYER